MGNWEKNNLHILVINPFGIGDVLFSTPLLANIRENYPKAYISYLCNKRVAPLFEANPNVDEVFVYERDEWLALWKRSRFNFIKKLVLFLHRIRRGRFHIAIDLSLSRQYGFFLWLIRVPRRIGFDYKDRGLFLTHKIKIDGYHHKHVAGYYLELCRFLDIKPEVKKMAIYLTKDEEESAKAKLIDKGIDSRKDVVIGIVPGGGASWGKEARLKHWSYNNVAILADSLVDKLKAKIIVFGDTKEAHLCRDVVGLMKNKPLNLSGELNFREFAACLKQCRLVVCNDGGPLHVAVALNVKTVSIFGPVNEKVYGPFPPSFDHVAISADVPCRPCYWRFKMPRCEKRECLDKISPKEVLQTVEMLL